MKIVFIYIIFQTSRYLKVSKFKFRVVMVFTTSLFVTLTHLCYMYTVYPANILYKSTAGRYRPVRVADGPITARCRFIKNANWEAIVVDKTHFF